jgi:Rieske Fe-S protein
MTQGATRRTVIATGAAALATGCGGNNGGSTSAAADNTRTESPSPTKPASPASPASPPSPAAHGKKLASTGDIPEGGGKVFDGQKIVVTQPSKGEFKAFSAVCTHMGCTVSRVQNGTIDCPCHGSRYRVEDGSVAAGPAPAPLAPQKVRVSGGQIRLT